MDTETLTKNVRNIALAAVLLACIVAAGFLPAIKTPIIRLGFGFVPVMFGAMLLPTQYIVVLAVLGDVIKYFLINSAQGPFNVGITIGATVAALIWSVAFQEFRKSGHLVDKKFIVKLVIASFLVASVANLGINTFALSIQLGKGFLALLFPWRLYSEIVSFIIHIPVGIALALAVKNARKTK